jgi:predicted dehydrogenase
MQSSAVKIERVAVFGLGSMGKRRLRLLSALLPNGVFAGIDAREDRRSEVAERFGAQVFSSLDDAMCILPQAIFICTSPLSHSALISDSLRRRLHVFTEINLVDTGYATNQKLAEQQGLTLFLSSTPLYRREPAYLIEQASKYDGAMSYQYHVGQYLPDWHPWENYRDFFISDARTNGCREIFAINLPWVLRAFGPVEEVFAVSAKSTALQIEYPDSRIATFRHKNGTIGTFTADLVAREPIHRMRIQSEHLLLQWDGTPESLRTYDMAQKAWQQIRLYEDVDQLSGYSANIIEDAYAAEISAFFAAIEEGKRPIYGFQEDQQTLLLIDRIEEQRT